MYIYSWECYGECVQLIIEMCSVFIVCVYTKGLLNKDLYDGVTMVVNMDGILTVLGREPLQLTTILVKAVVVKECSEG